MAPYLNRREAIKASGAVGIAGLAGCSGGGGEDGSAADTFEYTLKHMFGSDDAVVGSSLTGVRVNLRVHYSDGSGPMSDASVAAATLGGSDVTDDLDGASSSDNGATLTVDFGGAYDISAGDTLAIELSGVPRPDDDVDEVEVVINPQSGGTTFEAWY